jgi:hypothetical protein
MRTGATRAVARAGAFTFTITIAAGCGGGGSSGTPTAPTPPLQAPPPASSQPPSVNVNGLWEGTYARDGGSGTIKLALMQNGSAVSGGDSITEDKERGGNILGTLSGNTLTFNLQFGSNCVRTLSGTATVSGDTMTGTFSGGDAGCPEGPVTNGRMTLRIPRPAAPSLSGTSWWGSSPGTPTPPVTVGILGSVAWLWQYGQVGSNANGIVDFTASVRVGSGGPSNFGPGDSSGTLTGTLTQDFNCPGAVATCVPHYFWRVRFAIAVTGKCPAMLNGADNPTINGEPFVGNAETQFNGTVSGTTCSGAANGVTFNLCRVGSAQCQ